MGISSTASPPKTFSDDILSIEVTGPDQEHLSVIDVPGIFKKTTEGVTTKADMALVTAMVESFVSNPRSIILAVVPANVDIATQEILDTAEKHDPHGERTLGVLTKPDLVDKGAEQTILDLLNDRVHRLSLGWCVVRNLGQREFEEEKDRFKTEKEFFNTREPWNQVEKTRAGVEALKGHLARVWSKLTRREFPKVWITSNISGVYWLTTNKVKIELDKILKECEARLKALGPQRMTAAEQSSYLIKIASEFQTKTRMALEATYYTDDNFDNIEWLRLANNIVNRNDTFAKTFSEFGHTYKFKEEALCSSDFYEDYDESSDELDFDRGGCTTFVDPVPELGDILEDMENLGYPIKAGVASWLSGLYHRSRGFELGTFDPKLLATAMKQQSTKWSSICRGYISDVVVLTHRYILEQLQILCPDERIRSELLDLLIEPILQGYRNAVAQVDFILNVERSMKPSTQNHYFNDTLRQL